MTYMLDCTTNKSPLVCYRHVVFAPAATDSYSSAAFPGITDALYEIADNDDAAWEGVKVKYRCCTWVKLTNDGMGATLCVRWESNESKPCKVIGGSMLVKYIVAIIYTYAVCSDKWSYIVFYTLTTHMHSPS